MDFFSDVIRFFCMSLVVAISENKTSLHKNKHD